MRTKRPAISISLSATLMATCLLLVGSAGAQTASQGTRIAQAAPQDPSAQPAPRPPRRLRIYPRSQAAWDDVYPRYDPGPNAVRVCSASYVQEHRPSGTVIVPHMTCVWR